MRRRTLSVLAALVVSLGAGTARAAVRTHVVVMLAVELPADARAPDAGRLRAAGLVLQETPSRTHAGDRRPRRRYVGRVLARRLLGREEPEDTRLAVPSAGTVSAVGRALAALGIPGRPEMVVLVVHEGGR